MNLSKAAVTEGDGIDSIEINFTFTGEAHDKPGFIGFALRSGMSEKEVSQRIRRFINAYDDAMKIERRKTEAE